MRMSYLILLGIASFLWQPCQSQVVINEELKNKLGQNWRQQLFIHGEENE